MPTRLAPEPDVAELLAPVRAELDAAVARLDGDGVLPVRLGDAEGFWTMDEGLVLDRGLAGPGLHHPLEAALPLDRWRRSAGSVLEAIAWRGLVDAGVADAPAWIARGAAVRLAHRAWPELGLLPSALLRCRATGDPAAHPRAGAAFFDGDDPAGRARAWSAAPPSAEALLALARELLDTELGLAVTVGRPTSVLPRVGPWRFAVLTLGGGPQGGRVVVEGDGAVHPALVPAGSEVEVVLASTSGASVHVAPSGPFGLWRFASARGFGELLGVRGIDFRFDGDGVVEILLADAFVGPLPALEFAEEVGTSGVVRGRWSLVGDNRVRFDQLVPMGVTVHGRKDADFRMPAPGAGLESYISRLEGSSWAWRRQGPELLLDSDELGAPMTLRLVAR